MGVTNAHKITTNLLADSKKYLGEQDEFATQKGKKLTEATSEEINKFIEAEGGAEKVRINDIFSAENKEAAKGEITKTLVYEIKPMSTEDAKLKLESTDDMFLTFVNSKTNEVNVIYKRGDGTFGMVIPE